MGLTPKDPLERDIYLAEMMLELSKIIEGMLAERDDRLKKLETRIETLELQGSR